MSKIINSRVMASREFESVEPGAIAGAPRMVKAPLVVADSGEPTAGAILPICITLLQKARDAWIQKFHQRANAGIVDDDRELWTKGFLREDDVAESSPPGCVLLAAGEVQGIVVFDSMLESSRMARGAHALYVRYLATAPWNRTTGERRGRFCGVGRALVRQAVRESIQRGTPGRVGLYSFVNAAPFFEKLSFENLGGADAGHGLVYLELRPGAAFEML